MLAKLLWKLEMLYMNHLPLSIYEYQMQERSGKKSVINTWILWSVPRLIRALDDIYEYQMQERSGKKSVINTWILWSILRLIRALDDRHTVLDYPNVLGTQDYKYKPFL